jgi:hypothetical protein
MFGSKSRSTPGSTLELAARELGAALGRLALAPRQAHKSLTLWPLFWTDGPPEGLEYVTLTDALAGGGLVIAELQSGASVPHVVVRNRGPVATLILFGEELVGARQNRVANASFLVPAHGEVVIDVSCVEQGRWSRRRGETFHSVGGMLSHEIRRKMAQHVSASRRSGGGFAANQREVWDEVHERVQYSLASSPTSAYQDYVATRERDLAELEAAFRPIPGQVGFVASVGEEVVGLEAIGRPAVFERAFSGLLRSYLIDAIDHALVRERRHAPPRQPRFDAPEPFLEALNRAPREARPSLGLGVDVRLEDARVGGCALVADTLVHFTAFPAV